MARQKRKPANNPSVKQQQNPIPSEIKISGTVNTIAEKPKRSATSIISVVISAIALAISILSFINSRYQLNLDAAPKFGLSVSYYKGDYENNEDEDYTIYHGPAEDEEGNRYNYSYDRKVRTVEVTNEGAPIKSVEITTIPYFRIYETSRIYDEDLQSPIGMTTDLYYLPIDNREAAYAIYRNGTSQGMIAVIGDAFPSWFCVMKIGNDQLKNEHIGGYPRFTCFEEDMFEEIIDRDKSYEGYVRSMQEKYREYSYQGDSDATLKEDINGYPYIYGKLKVITLINLAYYLKIDYTDYLGRDGQKIYNVNTGYYNQYWSYYYSTDLPGIYDVPEEDEIYRRMLNREYSIAYTPDDSLNTSFEVDGIKYTANIIDYMLSEHDLRKHIETRYVAESNGWEW